jgi:hypothetical protein
MGRRTRVLLALGAAGAVASPLAPVVASGGSSRARGAGSGEVRRQFLGTWQLITVFVADERGTIVGYPYGKAPEGKLTYTRDGQVWAYTGEGGPARSDRPANWYTGTFRIDVKRHRVVHRARYSSIRAWEGTRLPRQFKFSGPRRLRLSTLPTGPEGAKTHLVLRWKKLR